MKLSEITVPGFYWNRFDEHREWTMVYVAREAKNPAHPEYNAFFIDGAIQPVRAGLACRISPAGEFIGPIAPPTV